MCDPGLESYLVDQRSQSVRHKPTPTETTIGFFHCSPGPAHYPAELRVWPSEMRAGGAAGPTIGELLTLTGRYAMDKLRVIAPLLIDSVC